MRTFTQLARVLAVFISFCFVTESIGQAATCGAAQYPNSCPIIQQPEIMINPTNCTITFSYSKCSSNNNCLFWGFEPSNPSDYTIVGSPFFAGQACTLSGGQDDGDCAGGATSGSSNIQDGYNPSPTAECTEIDAATGSVYGTIKHVSNNVDPDECEISIGNGVIIPVLVVQYNGDCSGGNLPPFNFIWDSRNSINCNSQCASGSTPFPYTYTPDSLFNPILPVKLVKFEGIHRDGKVQLEWRTENEVNNKGFEILRSGPSGEDLDVIGFVGGFGDSTIPINYRYTDENPLAGENIYQLRQVDFDGRNELSNSIVIRVDLSIGIAVNPNPNNGSNARVFITTDHEERTALVVYSMDGRMVYNRNINLYKGVNTVNLEEVQLNPGIYFATVPHEGGILKQKFFVQ